MNATDKQLQYRGCRVFYFEGSLCGNKKRASIQYVQNSTQVWPRRAPRLCLRPSNAPQGSPPRRANDLTQSLTATSRDTPHVRSPSLLQLCRSSCALPLASASTMLKRTRRSPPAGCRPHAHAALRGLANCAAQLHLRPTADDVITFAFWQRFAWTLKGHSLAGRLMAGHLLEGHNIRASAPHGSAFERAPGGDWPCVPAAHARPSYGGNEIAVFYRITLAATSSPGAPRLARASRSSPGGRHGQ